jgi:RNA polymerase sigma-70 factor (ECF subfamily)
MTPVVVAVTTTDVLAAGRLVEVRAAPDDREGQLLVEARRNTESFTELYQLTERRIVKFFYRRTACPVTAADLAAETFAAALQSVRRFDPNRGSGSQYLFGIANKLLLQWQRHEYVERSARQRLGMQLQVSDSAAIEEIETLVDFDAMKAELADALDELTDGVRDAVKLRIFEQLSYEEIAERLGCAPGNARVRVSRGLDRLGQRLGAS